MMNTNINNKYYTLSIKYVLPDMQKDEIEFCVHTIQEAVDLFNNYCIDDLHLKKPLRILSILPVYNKDDADYYKDEYSIYSSSVKYISK